MISLNVKYIDVNINFITFTNSALDFCGPFYVFPSFYDTVYHNSNGMLVKRKVTSKETIVSDNSIVNPAKNL